MRSRWPAIPDSLPRFGTVAEGDMGQDLRYQHVVGREESAAIDWAMLVKAMSMRGAHGGMGAWFI